MCVANRSMDGLYRLYSFQLQLKYRVYEKMEKELSTEDHEKLVMLGKCQIIFY